MSSVEELAHESLRSAQADGAKSQRIFWLVAGALALIHLLTVYPYLKTTREIADLEVTMATDKAALAELEPEIARLQGAGDLAGKQLKELLEGTTTEMIAAFADLRDVIAQAQRGESPTRWPSTSDTHQQSLQVPQMQMQQMNLPAPREDEPNMLPSSGSGIPPELREILEGLGSDSADAPECLRDYARREIVQVSYARIHQSWARDIRPAYLRTLELTEEKARRVAAQAREAAPATASALIAAADELVIRKTAIAALEISPDRSVDSSLDAEWWHSVEGKQQVADAVGVSVSNQLNEIAAIASAPASILEQTLALQQEIQHKLEARQEELERQFSQAHEQLISLSGSGGLLPIDLVSGIGLFPLLLGLVLAFLLLRTAQARRQAAIAAEHLAAADDGDRPLRAYFVRRTLGDITGRVAILVTSAIAAVVVLWILLAAGQVADSSMSPPLSPWTAAGVGVLAIAVTALWDVAMTRRLARTLR